MLPLPDSLIWGALALAVLLCLARQRLPGFIMLAVALLAALGLGHLSPIALLASAAGLLLAWRTPSLPQPWRAVALGAVLLVMPHVIGAPQPEVHESLAPEALETQFKVASWLTNAAFWLALGLLSAWLFRRSSQA